MHNSRIFIPDREPENLQVKPDSSNSVVAETRSNILRLTGLGLALGLSLLAISRPLEAKRSKTEDCLIDQEPESKLAWVFLEGVCKDGLAHGRGKARSSMNDIYEGQFKEGSFHGHGKMTHANGETYIGEWAIGVIHGNGTFNYADGSQYTGQWQSGKRHGRGTHTWPTGQRYEGEWQNDKKNGQGKMKFSHGIVWTGGWRDNERIDKGGTWSFDNPTLRTPNALYVYAERLKAEGNVSDAKVIYDHIIRYFPDSNAAVKAAIASKAVTAQIEKKAKYDRCVSSCKSDFAAKSSRCNDIMSRDSSLSYGLTLSNNPAADQHDAYRKCADSAKSDSDICHEGCTP